MWIQSYGYIKQFGGMAKLLNNQTRIWFNKPKIMTAIVEWKAFLLLILRLVKIRGIVESVKDIYSCVFIIYNVYLNYQ